MTDDDWGYEQRALAPWWVVWSATAAGLAAVYGWVVLLVHVLAWLRH